MLTKSLGMALVVFGLILGLFTIYWRYKDGSTELKYLSAIIGLAFVCGLILLFANQITEFEGWGTKIKMATQQAVIDAEAVAKLRQQVENQSATVHLVASEATKAKELSETAVNQTRQAEDKLKTLDSVIRDATNTISKLKEESDFLALTVAAQNDDRPSFDRLKEIADDPENRFSGNALQAYSTIVRTHSNPIWNSFQVPWASGVDPMKLSLTRLKDIYGDAPTPLKPGLLEFIWNRTDIPQTDRMNFLLQVMKTDKSLTALEYAGRYFLQGAQAKELGDPLAADRMSDWWDKHKSDFAGRQ
jgi:hypothetical protein